MLEYLWHWHQEGHCITMLRTARQLLPTLALSVEQRLLAEGSNVLRMPGAAWAPACSALQQLRSFGSEQQRVRKLRGLRGSTAAPTGGHAC